MPDDRGHVINLKKGLSGVVAECEDCNWAKSGPTVQSLGDMMTEHRAETKGEHRVVPKEDTSIDGHWYTR